MDIVYSDRIRDRTNCMYSFHHRWYDPKTGQFLSPDPVDIDIDNPFTFNKYAFCNNNTWRYSDPEGLKLFDRIVDNNEPNANGNAQDWVDKAYKKNTIWGEALETYCDFFNFMRTNKYVQGTCEAITLAYTGKILYDYAKYSNLYDKYSNLYKNIKIKSFKTTYSQNLTTYQKADGGVVNVNTKTTTTNTTYEAIEKSVDNAAKNGGNNSVPKSGVKDLTSKELNQIANQINGRIKVKGGQLEIDVVGSRVTGVRNPSNVAAGRAQDIDILIRPSEGGSFIQKGYINRNIDILNQQLEKTFGFPFDIIRGTPSGPSIPIK